MLIGRVTCESFTDAGDEGGGGPVNAGLTRGKPPTTGATAGALGEGEGRGSIGCCCCFCDTDTSTADLRLLSRDTATPPGVGLLPVPSRIVLIQPPLSSLQQILDNQIN
jgi:hypothetical protein